MNCLPTVNLPQQRTRLLPLVLAPLLIGFPVHGETPSLNSHFEQHCVRCHGDEKSKGGLNLTQLLLEQPLVKNRERWNNVIDMIQHGDMPPEDETQPTANQKQDILSLLDRELNHFDYSSVDNPGFEQARRLTNQEYNRTVSDLFAMPLHVADRFPSDLTGDSGFENSANTLFLQTGLMERYIAAAERIVDSALPTDVSSNNPTPAFHRIVKRLPDKHTTPLEAAKTTLQEFLLRAYRRPANEEELQQALRHFEASLPKESGEAAYIEGIRRVVQATLISPKFLLRLESGAESPDPYRINDFELASRLSYFLWASMPDDTLLDLAEQGILHHSDVLEDQIDRMLQDPKAETLGSIFAAQWLGFRFMGNRVRLDPIDNPWCTDTLMTAMREESGLFFTSLIHENRPFDDLIKADYTYLNEELANEIYRRDDVKGSEMRKVRLDDPNRGGILTHGSLMAITSNYKETSPIKRGNWLLETMLGRPLPPPPPNAGSFSEDVEEDDTLTFRQKVELHSSNPNCRSCHSKIDPLGFSLENFDYFGRWRESYRVRVIERQDEVAFELAQAMRALSDEELDQRLEDLYPGAETRERIRTRYQELRAMTDWELETELSKTISVSAQNRLIRQIKRVDPDNFRGDEEEERREFEQRPVMADATLPDGTPFQGPPGLKTVILTHHRDDLLRQLTSKMMVYALGRQLEYYDEGAIRQVMQHVRDQDYRMQAFLKGIASSYPFQYKKNPEKKVTR